MWAITVVHKATGEEDILMGYDLKDACRRRGLNPDDYFVVRADYED